MNILMISTDLGLLGERVATGDAVSRHEEYGRYVNELSILVFSPPGYQAKQLGKNVFIYPTNSRSRLHALRAAFNIAKKIMSTHRYELVVCQDPFFTGLVGYFIKKKFGSKLLVHFHGDFWDNKYWLKENWLRLSLLLLSKFIVPRSDALRVVSSGIKRKLVKYGVKADKIKVISTPVDIDKFKFPDNQAVNNIKKQFPNQKIILWVGKMRSEKNLPFILRCFDQVYKKYSKTVLILVGSGIDFQKINRLAAKLPSAGNIYFVGHVDYQMIINYFHASDIFVLPSRHESFGKVLLEAAAAGKPSVASATTGAKEIIINNQTGFLTPVNGRKQFTDKLLKLLNNNDLAAKMGVAAYKHITEKFNYKFSIAQVVDYWSEIINGENI